MTRASLLHILDHVSAISDAEVRELEQLATAFPYCQTAHLLLAKAAHDKGSMLAGQRLRRAATYAPDRQLLRQLIEQQTPTPALPPEAPAEPVALLLPAERLALPAPPDAPAPVATQPAEVVGQEPPTAALVVPLPTPELVAPTPAGAVDAAAVAGPAESLPVAVVDADSSATTAQVLSPAQEPVPVEEPAPVAEEPAADTPEELLPAVAPPIRPLAETGTSRFEFGLGEVAAADVTPYALADEQPGATVKAPAFYADPEIGYTIGYGSRLGACLQAPQDELTNDLPDTRFFPADALLLEHLATQQAVAAAPTSLVLIERFLRKQPRLRTPATLPAAAEQTDLSVPSTSATPALASESLAKIMVRQGKTAKAIEIYERLIVRQPEKKAYFAAQIDQLKQSE